MATICQATAIGMLNSVPKHFAMFYFQDRWRWKGWNRYQHLLSASARHCNFGKFKIALWILFAGAGSTLNLSSWNRPPKLLTSWGCKALFNREFLSVLKHFLCYSFCFKALQEKVIGSVELLLLWAICSFSRWPIFRFKWYFSFCEMWPSFFHLPGHWGILSK